MRNIEFSIEDDLLTITVDLSKEFVCSKSGRSRIVASTEGNVRLFGDKGFREEILNLNVTKRIRPDDGAIR